MQIEHKTHNTGLNMNDHSILEPKQAWHRLANCDFLYTNFLDWNFFPQQMHSFGHYQIPTDILIKLMKSIWYNNIFKFH